jgi:hypothetical protein
LSNLNWLRRHFQQTLDPAKPTSRASRARRQTGNLEFLGLPPINHWTASALLGFAPDLLGIPWILSSESGLFNGLRPKSVEKIFSRPSPQVRHGSVCKNCDLAFVPTDGEDLDAERS